MAVLTPARREELHCPGLLLERFIGAYRQGPQTSEPGAACTGGVGDPA